MAKAKRYVILTFFEHVGGYGGIPQDGTDQSKRSVISHLNADYHNAVLVVQDDNKAHYYHNLIAEPGKWDLVNTEIVETIEGGTRVVHRDARTALSWW